ncbi:MAG: transglutaminase domain-containing protein [Terricaulis sp.]
MTHAPSMGHIRLCVFVMLVALCAPAALSQPAPETPSADAHWYVIDAGDAHIGYAWQQHTNDGDSARTVTVQALSWQERGSPPSQTSDTTTVTEDASGRPLTIETNSNTGDAWTHTRAEIHPGRALVSRTTATSQWSGDVQLPAGVRFDDGAELLRNWDPAQSPKLEFDNFSLDAMGVEHVVMAAAHAENPIIALRLRYQGAALVGVARLTIDHREIVDVARPMFGVTVHVRSADAQAALTAHAPYEVLPNAMTRAPYRISSTQTLGHVRYRFSFRDGLTFPLPRTGEQRAIVDENTATIDVCRTCGEGLGADPATLADALRATAWLQSDDRRLRAIAAPVGHMPLSGERKMQMLMRRAQPYFARIDFVGHYSALETLSRHAGDCTEAAVLLAALGRAAGIPTRVASGLVYSRQAYHGVSNAFLPHSWTLAYVDGRWKSFDLALENFDSTHIALTVGDGDETSIAAASQLASLLLLDDMAEVRTRSRS